MTQDFDHSLNLRHNVLKTEILKLERLWNPPLDTSILAMNPHLTQTKCILLYKNSYQKLDSVVGGEIQEQ